MTWEPHPHGGEVAKFKCGSCGQDFMIWRKDYEAGRSVWCPRPECGAEVYHGKP